VTRSILRAFVLLTGLSAACIPLLADGGTLQFRKAAGPFTVTLFTAPVPLRAGVGDFSVLVQDEQDNALVDGSVTIQLSKADERDIVAKATTAQATNKLLYAARVELPSAGKWEVRVQVRREGLAGSASGGISVLSEEPPVVTYWLYFAVVPVGILLFVLNQWLKRKQRRRKGDASTGA